MHKVWIGIGDNREKEEVVGDNREKEEEVGYVLSYLELDGFLHPILLIMRAEKFNIFRPLYIGTGKPYALQVCFLFDLRTYILIASAF